MGVVRCRELVDFYHVVQHVYALAALNKSWRASYRKQWVTRQRRRLWRGELKAFIEDVERLCRGKRGKDWARERDYLLRNARAGRLDYAKARRAKMPMGSGSMESAVRRVVNLRLKGAGIFWHEDHAEQMLMLRAYYKSKHWQVLMNKAFASPLTNAAQLLQERNAPAQQDTGIHGRGLRPVVRRAALDDGVRLFSCLRVVFLAQRLFERAPLRPGRWLGGNGERWQ